MSMQEAQAREDAQRAAAEPSTTSTLPPAAPVSAEDEEDAELQRAIALSHEVDVDMSPAAAEDDDDAMDEDERIAQAIAATTDDTQQQKGEEKKKK